MAVDTYGTILFKGETGQGHPVKVHAELGRIRILAGEEVVGDWSIHDIGVVVLDDGFSIKAEGEVFLLRAEDDVGVAEELGVATASPRMARRVAARHNPDRPLLHEVEEAQAKGEESKLASIGVAVAGALVVLGAALLSVVTVPPGNFDPSVAAVGPVPFWMAFMICGVALVFFAFLIAIRARWARIPAMLVIAAEVLLFGLLINQGVPHASTLLSYGFIAGGLVVGVAVLFSGRAEYPA